MSGWIKIHRKVLEWEWYSEPYMFRLFTHLLLKANHKPKKWKGVMVERGQIITGRKALSKETGISERSIRTCLNKLKSTSELTIKTTNRFSIITICNYEEYQKLDGATDQQTDQQTANKRPATDHKQEVKEVKEVITHLNKKAGKNFKTTTKKTKDSIRARLADKFTVEDMKKVIDIKTRQWSGTDFDRFLRPETLFGSKFEGYLNEKDEGESQRWV